MSKRKYIEVILPFRLKGTFSYAVPEELSEKISIGMRVLVPFGKAHIYTAIVKSFRSEAPDFELRDILELLDEVPMISEKGLELWAWIAEYYMCSEGEVFAAATPKALNFSSDTILKIKSNFNLNLKDLKSASQALANNLLQNGDQKLKDLAKLIGARNIASGVKELEEKGALESYEQIHQIYKPRTIKILNLNFDPQSNLDEKVASLKGKKQKELLEFLISEKLDGAKDWVLKDVINSGYSRALINALIKKEMLKLEEVVVSRLDQQVSSSEIPNLSTEQEEAFSNIKSNFDKKPVQLLFGVTSSGKTEIYAQLIKAELEKGKQVLYLLPEIALAGQLQKRLQAYFGKDMLVYHSRMSNPEQFETWQAVRDQSAKLVLGTRSSIFLPFQELSLIIVDEEHDPSYKQSDPAPRYSTRDLAVFFSDFYGVKTLLGSATPSMESYYNALRNKYGMNVLTRRYGDWKMPEFVVDNMLEAYRKKQVKASFGPQLYHGIKEALEKNEQVILFQNRRGFSTHILCENCGHIPQCPNCDISLTYHKFTNKLSCHYCSHSRRVDSQCTKCSSPRIKTKGIGTEKLEEELYLLFPEAKLARMDLDTTRGKKAFQKIAEKMESGKIDILVGTQMLTKGFDFSNIGLAGVINADNLMFFPEFRSFERSFQMLTQVAGRAGRKSNKAKVVIQTYQPDNDVIKAVSARKTEAFLKSQLHERSSFYYPPYSRLIEVYVLHKVKKKLEIAAIELRKLSTFEAKVKLLGPEFEEVQRLRSFYRMRMILKFPSKDHSYVKSRLHEVMDQFSRTPSASGIRFNINVDPY